MNRIFTYNTVKQQFWYQKGSDRFQVGQITSSFFLETLINNAKSDGAVIIDTTLLDNTLLDRIIKTYFNGRGIADEPEEFAEALILNGAIEVK